MTAFWLSFALVFLAELGDKTQLVALTLATRFNVRVVLAGIFVATLLLNVISVLLGGLVGGLLPIAWVKFAAGLVFIAFGIWTLREDTSDESESVSRGGGSPFWAVTGTFFIGELGDKTMLSAATLATSYPMVPVWLGATAGMLLSDGLAIWIGTVLGSRLPKRLIQVGAAYFFFAFGLFSLVQGGVALPPASLGRALGVVLIVSLISLGIRKAVWAKEGGGRR